MEKLNKYYEVRDQIGLCDGFSWIGTGPLSTAISVWTHRTHWSQRGPIVDFENTRENGILSYEALDGEVNLRRFSEMLKNYDGKCYWHSLKPELNGFRIAMHRQWYAMIGDDYDEWGLVLNAIERQKMTIDGPKFCSEAGSIAIAQGIPRYVLEEYMPNKYLNILLNEKRALRPGGMAMLPIWKPEVRLI